MRRGVGSRHRCSLPISISIFVVHENERGDGGRAGLCSKRLGRRCAGSNVRAQLLGRLVPTEVQVISQFKNSLTDFSKHFKNQKRSNNKSGIFWVAAPQKMAILGGSRTNPLGTKSVEEPSSELKTGLVASLRVDGASKSPF